MMPACWQNSCAWNWCDPITETSPDTRALADRTWYVRMCGYFAESCAESVCSVVFRTSSKYITVLLCMGSLTGRLCVAQVGRESYGVCETYQTRICSPYPACSLCTTRSSRGCSHQWPFNPLVPSIPLGEHFHVRVASAMGSMSWTNGSIVYRPCDGFNFGIGGKLLTASTLDSFLV